MMGASLNHCKKMEAEAGKRFLKQRAANIEPVIVIIDKRCQIPVIGAFHYCNVDIT